MAAKEQTMPKAHIEGGELRLPLTDEIREKLDVHEGDEIEVSAETGRVVLTVVAEEPLPGELEAIERAEQEFARGETRPLRDVLHDLGRTAQ